MNGLETGMYDVSIDWATTCSGSDANVYKWTTKIPNPFYQHKDQCEDKHDAVQGGLFDEE